MRKLKRNPSQHLNLAVHVTCLYKLKCQALSKTSQQASFSPQKYLAKQFRPRTQVIQHPPTFNHVPFSLFLPLSCSPCHPEALVPIKNTQKPSSRSTLSSHNRKPPPTQTAIPPHLPHPITKVWPSLLPQVRFPPRSCRFITIRSARMLLQKRHRPGKPASLSRGKVYWLQQHNRGVITLR